MIDGVDEGDLIGSLINLPIYFTHNMKFIT